MESKKRKTNTGNSPTLLKKRIPLKLEVFVYLGAIRPLVTRKFHVPKMIKSKLAYCGLLSAGSKELKSAAYARATSTLPVIWRGGAEQDSVTHFVTTSRRCFG
jgi:hypothetical protein